MGKRTYSMDAPDQQRLKLARAKIEGILKEHDLAGVVVLHTPGMTEFFHDVTPSYSCAWIDEAAGQLTRGISSDTSVLMWSATSPMTNVKRRSSVRLGWRASWVLAPVAMPSPDSLAVRLWQIPSAPNCAQKSKNPF